MDKLQHAEALPPMYAPTMTTPSLPLPADTENQTHVTVHALRAGGFFLANRRVFQDCVDEPEDVGYEVPFIAFMVTHPTHGRTLFDLGMRKHAEGWPPVVDRALPEFKAAQYCKEDIVDVLRKGSVDPKDIRRVIFSHLHWDHTGDLDPFTHAELVLGSDSKVLLKDTYPSNPESDILALPKDMKTDFVDFADSQKYSRVAPFGPYERAVDFFGDGSFYLVDSPGHLVGHLGAAARVAFDSLVFFAGDTCHNRLCYDPGERLVSERVHQDVVAARKTVQSLVKLNREYPNVIVVLAHEKERLDEMPFFPNSDMKQWLLEEITKRKGKGCVY